ncbi:unnamed protein product [Pseudo-nitzschia multistriata]|uniref:DOT1 domain-containing protein n=1 Tax=Pseudo-nitzschia multistriata TaxID=183589 RepID=A0A448ZLB5_9STRA|nr:unnamed protein product [Pseudo-nitzschia multistriata]
MNDIFGFVKSVGKSIFSPGSNSSENSKTPSSPRDEGNNSSDNLQAETTSPMRGPAHIPGITVPLSSQKVLKTNESPVIGLVSTKDQVIGGDGRCDGKEDTGRALRIHGRSLEANLKTIRKESSAERCNVTDLKPTPSPSTKSPSLATSDTSNVYFDEEGGNGEGKENAAATTSVTTTSVTIISKPFEDPLETSTVTFGNTTDPKSSLLASTKPPPSATTTGVSQKRRRQLFMNDGRVSAFLSSSPSSSSNGIRVENQHDKEGKKHPPQHTSKEIISISRSTLRLPRNETIHGDVFAFPGVEEGKDQQQRLGKRRDPSPDVSIASKTSKRPRNDDSLKSLEESIKSGGPEENDLNSDKDDKPSVDDPVSGPEKTQHLPKVAEEKEAQVQSPEKIVPEFRLPPELVPFNNPGVCDYGVIRTSRLRNRTKKADTPEDILYQNIQGQRRCRATKDGLAMTGDLVVSNRCLNCAEGVFKYCHNHRELDPDQKLYWERRKSTNANSNSCGKSWSTVKSNRKTKMKKKMPTSARTKEELSIKGSEANSSHVINNLKQCVYIVGKGRQLKRCMRNSLNTHPGFCAWHYGSAPPHQGDKFFQEEPSTMRCIGITKAGTQCRYKALNRSVFCCKHINFPPEKVSSAEILPEKKLKYGDRANQSSSERLGSITGSAKLSKGRTGGGNNAALSKNSECDSTTNSRSFFSGSGKVPKNIEFKREIKISTHKLELATSAEERCNFIYNSKRCSYKCMEDSAICFKCRQCHEEKMPCNHILEETANDKKKIFPSYQCFSVKNRVQCQEDAIEGKIFCVECFRLFSRKHPSTFDLSENSGRSETEEDSSSCCSSDTETSFGDSDNSEHSNGSDDYDSYCTAYTHQQFFNMWKNFERKTERMDEIEDTKLIKRANNTIDPTDTDGQVKAQYGRVLPHAMKKLMKILELGPDDIFLDIGHGVGNTCLHASFCIGCDSRGIEVVSDRHEIAEKFRGGMYAEHKGAVVSRPKVGSVDLRLGRLEDPSQKDFLTKGVTRAYVNNFNGVFAERSSKNNDKWFLDDYIAGLFASMAPGAIMVTFHPLNLGLNRSSTNELRTRHELEQSEYASYYHSEKILLGKAWNSVKWNKRSGNTNDIYIYKYRRLAQPNHDDAVFLCCNPTCKLAIDMKPIPATTLNEDGRCVINHCECRFSPKNLRKRNSK